jgi:6-pyruvoyltetrahydropterin/6-carboxytetrahydropterin synthase
MFELSVEDSFDAAHALRDYKGPCENLHGHTWKVQVSLEGKNLNEIGLLEDFKTIKNNLRKALLEFDHKFLNDLKPFETENPSSENLAKIIYKMMKGSDKMVTKVMVWESPTSRAAYWE